MVLTNLAMTTTISLILMFILIKILTKTSLIHSLKKLFRSLADKCYVYQSYKVPKFNENMQENQLYRKVHTYLNSLPCVEDSDHANLFSGTKPTEINLLLDENQTVEDHFLSARLSWKIERRSLLLKIRKNDKRRVLIPYLQHIHQMFDEVEQKRRQVRLFVNVDDGTEERNGNGRWRSAPFTHPATMETVVMDADLKTRIKSDLESFLKSRAYYHRLGRVWKRSYLLYGPLGTGKSTFIAAMAKFLSYDVYVINMKKFINDSDLKYLLMQTTNRSLIVVEDLDRYLGENEKSVSLSGILNFMDGIFSCCGEERVMVFTMNCKDNIDPSVLRPGRVDVHIHFPLCDFTAFKTLASSHLGLKDHKLFPQVEEIFQTGASLSPAEICEIMISNRSSPSRALKTVITALQGNLAGRVARRFNESRSRSGREGEEAGENGLFGKEGHNGIHPMKEIKSLYGFLRARSSRKGSMDKLEIDFNERENGDSIHKN